MMISSLEKMDAAHDARKNAKTQEEYEAATKAYLEAEREHLRKSGVYVGDPNGKLSDLLPYLLVALMAIVLVAAIIFSFLARDASNDVKAQSNELDNVVLERCLQGNKARQATVKNLRSDVKGLKADLIFLRATRDFLLFAVNGATGTKPLVKAYNSTIIAKQATIAAKKDSIDSYIQAYAVTAVKPGAVQVKC